MPNLGLSAIAFVESSAILILLALYWLLARDYPARFFRLWIAGWLLLAGFAVGQLLYAWPNRPPAHAVLNLPFFGAALLFLASALALTGRNARLSWLWAVGGLGVAGILAQMTWFPRSAGASWLADGVNSSLLLASGWVLWRGRLRSKGVGCTLLSAALLLSGLHGLDRPAWPQQYWFLLRMSFSGLLELAMGIAMAVLVLEAGRDRTEDLNERLRRLALIAAAATHSFRMEEVLGEILHHLVESLDATHGLVRLVDSGGNPATLAIRASVGFSSQYLREYSRVPVTEAWACKLLESGAPFLVSSSTADPELREWMEMERLAAVMLVRIPGKNAPLGALEIGSAAPRTFYGDEIDFLANVANLLGLTVQNVRLFEQVAGAQDRWSSTFDSIEDCVLVHDLAGHIVRVNRALAQRLSSAPAALAGCALSDVLRRGGARWSYCPYCEGAAGKPDEFDPALGGNFLVSNSGFQDAGGERTGTIHVFKDVSERLEAEAKFRRLFENVQEGVFISTPEGRFVDCNDAFVELLGFDNRAELLQQGVAADFYADPAERDRLKRILREHGEATNFEFQLRRRDGEIRTVMESSFATRDAGGNITAYQGFVLDVTERKRAEQEIRRRNRELMALNSIAQTLGQSVDHSEVLGRVIRKVVELFGADLGAVYLLEESSSTLRRVAAAGFSSEYARSFPPVKVAPELLRHIQGVRATLLSPKGLPLPEPFRDVRRKEGIVDSHLAILWAKDRIIGGLVVASRSVREFSAAELNLLAAISNQIAAAVEKSLLLEETRQAYENLRLTQEQLLQSEKMAAVGQLISGVAHELNNPLTAILGYSQLLESSEHVSPRGAEYVEKLYKQAQRTHRIVQNLLSFARQQKPERLPVQLNQILEDTLILREYDLKLNNIQVHREYDPALAVTTGDTHQLQQVVLNILNNAVDAILEKSNSGEIWLRTAVAGGRLLVEITDSGPGVQDPHRVFDPFYTTKPVGKGTGLGLSICYGIVKEHGGEIGVRNSPPRGATFSISLPVLSPDAGAGGERPATEERLPWGRILLVDDEETVLDLEQEILQGRCQSVQRASTGREALEFLERESVDLVIADLKMAGEISGEDLYRWIQCHRPDLASRFVFTISHDRGRGDRPTDDHENWPTVRKPFEIDEFLRVLRQVLASDAAPLRR